MSEDHKLNARPARSKSGGALAPGLYLVATPIGNARDITLRALDVLAGADRLYAEDTRVTAKLLAMHAIARPMHSYREHNARTADDRIVEELRQGLSVALVSDAGSPLISDPGGSLVASATSAGFAVFPVPGASAAIAALTASALPADRFMFAGFLPAKSNERRRAIRDLQQVPATLIFYEAPSRLVDCLKDLEAVLGNRDACVARELTKLHEDIRRCQLSALIEQYEAAPEIRGEIVVLVAPPSPESVVEGDAGTEALVDARLAEAMLAHPVKDAAAIVAAALGLPRRTVYARALVLKQKNETSA
jgi:16S rRNA (cytidine1402-2'-O)-methyltransferase